MEEMPFSNEFESALRGFIKKSGQRAVAEIGSGLKRALAGGTEPFFRREMGERHLAHNIISHGMFLWFLTIVASLFTGSLIGWLLPERFRAVGGFCTSIGWLLSALVLVSFVKCCNENVKCLREFRMQRKPYHSRSRGKPRWAPLDELKIRLGASVVLLLFAPVTGIAFVVSMYITAGLSPTRRPQSVAPTWTRSTRRSRGNSCRTRCSENIRLENTYLYKPLPESMDPGMREDIAAAYVGKPVAILAQPPKPKEPAMANAPA